MTTPHTLKPRRRLPGWVWLLIGAAVVLVVFGLLVFALNTVAFFLSQWQINGAQL